MTRSRGRGLTWTIVWMLGLAMLAVPAVAPAALESPPDRPGAAAGPASAIAQEDWRDRAGGARVQRHRRGAIVRIGRGVTVGENERIEQDVVVLFGTASIQGRVDGNVVTVGGNIILGPRAVVGRDLTAVGGRVVADPTARIGGRTTEVAGVVPFFRVRVPREDVHVEALSPDWPLIARSTLGLRTVRWLLVVLLVAVAMFIARPRLDRLDAAWRASPLGAFVVGIVSAALIIPVVLFLVTALTASVVGIPLVPLVPALVIVLAVFWVLGFAAMARRLGSRLLGQAGDGPSGSLLAALVGLAILWIPAVAGSALWLASPALWFPAWTLILVSWAAEAVAWTAGLGAVIMSWLNRPL